MGDWKESEDQFQEEREYGDRIMIVSEHLTLWTLLPPCPLRRRAEMGLGLNRGGKRHSGPILLL